MFTGFPEVLKPLTICCEQKPLGTTPECPLCTPPTWVSQPRSCTRWVPAPYLGPLPHSLGGVGAALHCSEPQALTCFLLTNCNVRTLISPIFKGETESPKGAVTCPRPHCDRG